MSAWRQFEMYAGLILGVYFSNRLRDTPRFNSDVLAYDFLIASLLALVLMPVVYEKISFSSDAPFILRLGFYFHSGVFSDAVLSPID